MSYQLTWYTFSLHIPLSLKSLSGSSSWQTPQGKSELHPTGSRPFSVV